MDITNPRSLDLDALRLDRGSHAPDGRFCVMEAVAWVAGEPWSDRPHCASGVIGEFLRAWNDSMEDEDRQILKPLIPRLVGTAAGPEIEKRRSWMTLDWHCRTSAPRWLRAAGLEAAAAAIEAAAPIVDFHSAKAARGALNEAANQARAAWAAAGDAARAAAWAAAGDAAGDAAWAAAWAAAGDAAWDALRPVVVELQRSALELVDRMIACGEEGRA
jgi:hypothetical protein